MTLKRHFVTGAAFLCAMTQFAVASTPSTPRPPSSALAWMGVTLGEPEGDVLSTTGETGFIFPEPVVGSMTGIAYNIERASGLVDVEFHAGRVSSIGIRRSAWDGSVPSAVDPHGITLTMSRSDVAAKLGKGNMTSAYGRDTYEYKTPDGLMWRYSFLNEAMQWISVRLSDAAIDAMPPAPALTAHTGSSLEDALINGATDEKSGAANERDYLLEQHCPSGGHWHETQQALVKHGDRQYDVLTLSCADGKQKELYIDITSFFGKL